MFHFLFLLITSINCLPAYYSCQKFLSQHPKFHESIPCRRDQHDFIVNVDCRWNGHPSLPAIFKAYQPRGYTAGDQNQLNSQVLVFLNACTELNSDWSEYSEIDPVNHFLIQCLKNGGFNVQVLATFCHLKHIPRSQLATHFQNLNTNLISDYIHYDRFSQLANFFVSLHITLSLQFLCLYLNILSKPIAFLNIPSQLTEFLLLNLLISRLIYNNFLFY